MAAASTLGPLSETDVQAATTTERQVLTRPVPEAFARFGSAVAIDGETLVVSAPDEDVPNTAGEDEPSNAAADVGAVYVYARVGTTWTLRATIKCPGDNGDPCDPGTRFGHSVDVHDDVIAVSAPGANSGLGAVLVFRGSGSSWLLEQQINGTGSVSDSFGFDVAVRDDVLAVGAPNEGSADSGVVHTYSRGVGGTWSPLTAVALSDGAADAEFGHAVDLSNGFLVVGAPGADDSAGRAITFARGTGAGGAPTLSGTGDELMTVPDPDPDDRFGHDVAVDTGRLIVGAPGNDSSALDAGAAFAYVRDGPAWQRDDHTLAAPQVVGARFGTAVAVSRGVFAVGSPGESTAGVTRTYRAADPADAPALTSAIPGVITSGVRGAGSAVAAGPDVVVSAAPSTEATARAPETEIELTLKEVGAVLIHSAPEPAEDEDTVPEPTRAPSFEVPSRLFVTAAEIDSASLHGSVVFERGDEFSVEWVRLVEPEPGSSSGDNEATPPAIEVQVPTQVGPAKDRTGNLSERTATAPLNGVGPLSLQDHKFRLRARFMGESPVYVSNDVTVTVVEVTEPSHGVLHPRLVKIRPPNARRRAGQSQPKAPNRTVPTRTRLVVRADLDFGHGWEERKQDLKRATVLIGSRTIRLDGLRPRSPRVWTQKSGDPRFGEFDIRIRTPKKGSSRGTLAVRVQNWNDENVIGPTEGAETLQLPLAFAAGTTSAAANVTLRRLAKAFVHLGTDGNAVPGLPKPIPTHSYEFRTANSAASAPSIAPLRARLAVLGENLAEPGAAEFKIAVRLAGDGTTGSLAPIDLSTPFLVHVITHPGDDDGTTTETFHVTTAGSLNTPEPRYTETRSATGRVLTLVDADTSDNTTPQPARLSFIDIDTRRRRVLLCGQLGSNSASQLADQTSIRMTVSISPLPPATPPAVATEDDEAAADSSAAPTVAVSIQLGRKTEQSRVFRYR